MSAVRSSGLCQQVIT